MARTQTPIGVIISGSYSGQNIYALSDRDLAITSQLLPLKSNSEQILINNPSYVSAHINSEEVTRLEIIMTEDSKMDIGKVHDVNFWLGGKAAYFFNEVNKEKLYSLEIVFKNGETSLAKFHDNVFNNALEKLQGIQFEVKSKNPSFNAVPQGTQPVSARININPENVEPTITRIELFLKDREWTKAAAYCEAALDYFPTDYRLYEFLLLSDMKCQSVSDLRNCESSFASNNHYKKLIQFADEPLKKEFAEILDDIRKERIYNEALNSGGRPALAKFKTIKGYKDADEKAASLEKKIKEEETRAKQTKERLKREREKKIQDKYLAAIKLQENAEDLDGFKKALDAFEELKSLTNDDAVERHYDVVNRHKEISEKYNELIIEKNYSDAVALLASGELSKVKIAKNKFDTLANEQGYKDSKEKSEEAKAIIDAADAARRKKVKIILIVCAICLAAVIAIVMLVSSHNKAESYENAIALYKAENYVDAKAQFDQLSGYKDSSEWAAKCEEFIELEEQYQSGVQAIQEADYANAVSTFGAIQNYKDSADMKGKAQDYSEHYNSLVESLEKGDFDKAGEELQYISPNLKKQLFSDFNEIIEEFSTWPGTYQCEKMVDTWDKEEQAVKNGEIDWGGVLDWGDAEDLKIHAKVSVNNIEIIEGSDVSFESSLIVTYKDETFGKEEVVFDEWIEDEKYFQNFGWSSKNYLEAHKDEKEGSLKIVLAFEEALYQKVK